MICFAHVGLPVSGEVICASILGPLCGGESPETRTRRPERSGEEETELRKLSERRSGLRLGFLTSSIILHFEQDGASIGG